MPTRSRSALPGQRVSTPEGPSFSTLRCTCAATALTSSMCWASSTVRSECPGWTPLMSWLLPGTLKSRSGPGGHPPLQEAYPRTSRCCLLGLRGEPSPRGCQKESAVAPGRLPKVAELTSLSVCWLAYPACPAFHPSGTDHLGTTTVASSSRPHTRVSRGNARGRWRRRRRRRRRRVRPQGRMPSGRSAACTETEKRLSSKLLPCEVRGGMWQ